MVKVLYIMGSGRSGSTVIGNILGSQAELSHHGELCYISRNLRDKTVLCGCQSPFDDCQLWSDVVLDAFPNADTNDVADELDFNRRGYSGRHVIAEMLGRAQADSAYLKRLSRLYHALAERTGSSVLIDSSKTPSYAHLLGQAEGVELYLLHLVRDPRAVVYSWSKRKVKRSDTLNDSEFQEVHSADKAVLRWVTWNLTAESYRFFKSHHYLRVRYEDFINEPAAVLEKTLDFVGYRGHLDQRDGRTFEVSTNHTVWGNPNRINTGPVAISSDDEWKEKFDSKQKRSIWMRTFPLALKYGYSL